MRTTSKIVPLAWVMPLALLLWSAPVGGAEKAPGFSLKDVSKLQDAPVTLSRFARSVVLVNIFSPSCAICRAEITELAAVHDTFRDRENVRVIGIAMDPMVDPIRSLVKAAGIDYTVLMGELENLVTWKIKGFPTTFLINQQGEIDKRYEGLQDKTVLIRDIERLLNQGS